MNSTPKLSVVIGASLAASMAVANAAHADQSLFGFQSLSHGYNVAMIEGACGADKKAEGACGEKKKDGACGEKKAEGKCGEKMKAEGKCGEGKCGEKKKEGKCGEGKCGEKKDTEKK